VIVGFEVSDGTMTCPHFVQIPFADLLGDYASAPEQGGSSGLPAVMHLVGASPNPFNPSTTIMFDLARESDVELVVYSLAGRVVKTLKKGVMASGIHEVAWHGRDDAGARVASGVYICRLKSGGSQDAMKIVLLK